ncbi:Hypp6724 [Branchiostoma lanceolatum]|uniref:Hypp6724 protein n=1 Tax=Branchiostoma lanceolatum TaxID=7740 RepID=A0A8J9YVI0_BRALA|nr:Hypp6724 [Branchiostoma lanceolatum]
MLYSTSSGVTLTGAACSTQGGSAKNVQVGRKSIKQQENNTNPRCAVNLFEAYIDEVESQEGQEQQRMDNLAHELFGCDFSELAAIDGDLATCDMEGKDWGQDPAVLLKDVRGAEGDGEEDDDQQQHEQQHGPEHSFGHGLTDHSANSNGCAEETYLSKIYVPDGQKAPMEGDGLSCMRGVESQDARAAGNTPVDRLEGLELVTAEWHAQVTSLQDVYDDYYNPKEKGIFNHARNRYIAQHNALLTPRLSAAILHNKTINFHGLPGKNIPKDLFMEFLNRKAKDGLTRLGPNMTSATVTREGNSLGVLDDILSSFDRDISLYTAIGKHTVPDLKGEVEQLTEKITKRKGLSNKYSVEVCLSVFSCKVWAALRDFIARWEGRSDGHFMAMMRKLPASFLEFHDATESMPADMLPSKDTDWHPTAVRIIKKMVEDRQVSNNANEYRLVAQQEVLCKSHVIFQLCESGSIVTTEQRASFLMFRPLKGLEEHDMYNDILVPETTADEPHETTPVLTAAPGRGDRTLTPTSAEAVGSGEADSMVTSVPDDEAGTTVPGQPVMATAQAPPHQPRVTTRPARQAILYGLHEVKGISMEAAQELMAKGPGWTPEERMWYI